MDTPRHLLDALDLLTRPALPRSALVRAEGLGRSGVAHLQRLRGILTDRNLVGIGISEKFSAGHPTGELCLCFYVEKKIPTRRLDAERLIPPVVAAPLADENQPRPTAIFTDVKQLGRLHPLDRPRRAARAGTAKARTAKTGTAKMPSTKPAGTKPAGTPPNVQRSPLQSGYSIGHVDSTAGTLGAIVQRGRKYYVLSNAHVLSVAHGGARPAMGRKGDKVLYPGPADGGRLPGDWAAVLADIVPFKTGGTFLNRVDAALAEINRDRLDDLDFALYGVRGLPETIAPQRGMVVIKRGRTTGDTEGLVQDINFRAVIDYDAVGTVGFLDQVLCTPHTKPGDSGSLVVDKESGRIVGLHFAGASGGSVFNPIDAVVTALNVKFVEP